ncbi:hypothetical protein TRICI_002501 [Trichomonascus ciferrii]|uniref:Uncharacterized protein n=1 Tax=Trichomonascus ciferrii TaxID=44093 RepID=A0A642VBZ4_9ASCO|nr:hypothetical protein TRICI_002501 [Trichomonascus ciferrii]
MEQTFVLIFIRGLQNSNLETEVHKQKTEGSLGAMKQEVTAILPLNPAYNVAASSSENVAAAFAVGNNSLLHGIQGAACYSRPRNVFKPRQ